MENSIGKKLKFFRNRAGLSQLDLENQIDLAQGHLSRIESGDKNPSKETVHAIADVLKLNSKEVDYIIGALAKQVDENEINSAIQEVRKYFQTPGVLAYLIDDRWRFLYVSKSFPVLLNKSAAETSKLIGKSIIQIILDDSLGISKLLDSEAYEELILNQLYRYYHSVSFMQEDDFVLKTIELIESHPIGRKIWHKVIFNQDLSIPSSSSRKVVFNLGKMKFNLEFTREPLQKYPRFEVIEYIPTNPVIKLLSKLI